MVAYKGTAKKIGSSKNLPAEIYIAEVLFMFCQLRLVKPLEVSGPITAITAVLPAAAAAAAA